MEFLKAGWAGKSDTLLETESKLSVLWKENCEYPKGINRKSSCWRRYKIRFWIIYYYLVAFDDYSKTCKHYRVDKMLKLEVTKEAREGKEVFKNFDMATYSKATFKQREEAWNDAFVAHKFKKGSKEENVSFIVLDDIDVSEEIIVDDYCE